MKGWIRHIYMPWLSAVALVFMVLYSRKYGATVLFEMGAGFIIILATFAYFGVVFWDKFWYWKILRDIKRR